VKVGEKCGQKFKYRFGGAPKNEHDTHGVYRACGEDSLSKTINASLTAKSFALRKVWRRYARAAIAVILVAPPPSRTFETSCMIQAAQMFSSFERS